MNIFKVDSIKNVFLVLISVFCGFWLGRNFPHKSIVSKAQEYGFANGQQRAREGNYYISEPSNGKVYWIKSPYWNNKEPEFTSILITK